MSNDLDLEQKLTHKQIKRFAQNMGNRMYNYRNESEVMNELNNTIKRFISVQKRLNPKFSESRFKKMLIDFRDINRQFIIPETV